ncbi:MAG: hypothetical protein ACFFB2_02450 [Promethearchaeota archaeon]
MVKLFKRKSQQHTRDFKFETSLKLKELPLEEYAHVAHSFQVAILRFERMLKESLLEGYITSTTLEKVSQELNLAAVRNMEIPDTPSLQTIFGSESVKTQAKKLTPAVEAAEAPTPASITQPIPVATPSFTPPEPSPDVRPSIMDSSTKISTTRPKISFSFPETTEEPKEVTSSPTPTPSPGEASKKEITPPTIPKISFPALSKPPTIPSISPLAQSTGRREEDRATGIAILRKQMLTELKKIRSVVSEQDR